MSQIFLAENTHGAGRRVEGAHGQLRAEITDLKLFIKEYDIVSEARQPSHRAHL